MPINLKEYPNKIKANLWANRTHNVFYYNFVQEGKRHRGLIDLKSRVAWGKRDRVDYASAELVKIKIEKREGVISDKITLDVFMVKHYEMLEDTPWKRARKSHYERYISPIIGKKYVVSIRQLHIKECIKSQESKGLSPRTVKQTVEILSPMFKSAIANRLILHNPMDGINIKLPKTKKIVSNASEVLVEIYNAIMDEFEDEPFYQSLYLLAMQGRRKGEILNLKVDDVSLVHNYYVIRDTKTDDELKIFLPPYIKGLLQEFMMDSEYVFVSGRTGDRLVNIEKTTARIKKRLGWNFTLHYLRNVIVSAMAESGMEAIHLSGALGHQSAKTIDKYLTLNYLKGSELASDVIDGIVGR